MREAAFDIAGAQAVAAARPLLPLRVTGLGLTLGRARVLDGVDLTLGRHGCTVIMGPNGAGKSQLLKLLHGLGHASTGAISWNGTAPEHATRRQALVFQAPVLLRRTAAANIDFVLRARRLDPRLRDAALARVGLLAKAGCVARRLSGGEQQRLALARALATSPEVLLLDEPTASLDPASVLMIERIVAQARDAGTRVLLVTHDIGQARRLADEVVFLHAGRVQEHTPAEVFFDRPATQAARDYLDGRILL